MSALTKVAIVFHVVLSLMLAAGMIVFVNRTENFKTTMASQKSDLSRARSELAAAKNNATALAGAADLARKDRDTAIADGQKAAIALQTEIGSLKATIAEGQSSAKIMQVTADNITAALNASEAARKAQSDILDGTRKDNNELTTKYSQSQLAISDLTNKLEVAQRLLTNSTETVAELSKAKEAAEKQLADMGVKVAGAAGSGLQAGAPAINAVVRSTRSINGIPYATVSVGADAQVKAGMKFNVIDRDKGDFLGELTIEQVDEKEATGKLEGPHISDVRTGTEVRTQL